MNQCMNDPSFLRGSWLQVVVLIILTTIHGDINGVCPCSPVSTERAFVACDVRADSVDTDQVRVQGTACFQGPVQLCSGASGLPNPVIEGLWRIISPQGQPSIGPGESVLRPLLGRTRSVDCTGVIFTIDFHQQTADPADAFTLLKTIQAGDTLQFARIDPSSCEVIQAASVCAESDVVECGPVFTVSVFDAPGLFPLYAFPPFGDYVSLLNFGPKSSAEQLLDCTDCSSLACPDLLCWPVQVCTGLMANVIPPECTGLTGANEHILLNADHLSTVTVVAVPKVTLGDCSVFDMLCATRVGDRLRVYAAGISNQTPLNTMPVQLGWLTSPFEPFGAVGFDGDVANGIAIDLDGTIILAGAHDASATENQFAALQLIPNGTTQLGWATSLAEPFGLVGSNGDEAHGIAIDASGNAVLAGIHDPVAGPDRFAALQLVPDTSGSVGLGWAIALIAPFGVSINDQANGVAIDKKGSVILAGTHRTTSDISQFAALQLIPNGTSVQLGWAITLSGPFGPVDVGPDEGDAANAVVLDSDGNIILVGRHNPLGVGPDRFAALQLIPSGTSVQLGWATALSEPFGPVGLDGDIAFDVAVDCRDTLIIAGVHQQPNNDGQMAALQLIPVGTGVMLGWTIAPSAPFGPTLTDEARGVEIDRTNAIILGGFHRPSAGVRAFAALQLVPNTSAGVDLGWTAALPGVFGPNADDRAHGLAVDVGNSVILGGFHDPDGFPLESQFAAIQLRQPLVPAYGDYEITSINEFDDFFVFELALISTESSTVCGELCIKNLGPCCI